MAAAVLRKALKNVGPVLKWYRGFNSPIETLTVKRYNYVFTFILNDIIVGFKYCLMNSLLLSDSAGNVIII